MAMTGGTAKLLHTGYADGNTNHPIRLYAYYKIAQDVDANCSVVSCGLYITTVSGWWIGPWGDSKGSYVGNKANTFDGSIGQVDGTYWLVQNVRITVEHADDGTGSFTFYWKWGVNSPWGRVQYPSGSFGISLPTIPRASTLSYPSPTPLLKQITMAIHPALEGARHRLRYQIGNSYGELLSRTNSSLSVIWTPQAFLARQNTAGTVMDCLMTLDTFTDETAEEPIGTTTWIIRLTIPEESTFLPKLTAEFAPDGSLLPDDFPNHLYIESKTRGTASYTAQGRYGASVERVSLALDGEVVTGSSPLCSDFPRAGTHTLTLTALDSRGYQTTLSQTITVLPYAPPRLIPAPDQEEILVLRANGEGTADEAGGYIWVRTGVTYAPLTQDGTDWNSVSLSLLVTGEDLSAEYALPLADGVSDALAADGLLTARKSYTATLRAVDLLGGVGESTAAIPTEKITLHLGPGGGVGVGKYAEDPELFDVALPARFRRGVAIGEETLADFVAAREGADGWVVERRALGDRLLFGSLTLTDRPTDTPITILLPTTVSAGTAVLSFTGTTLPMPVSILDSTLTLRLVALGGEETDSGTLGVLLWTMDGTTGTQEDL